MNDTTMNRFKKQLLDVTNAVADSELLSSGAPVQMTLELLASLCDDLAHDAPDVRIDYLRASNLIRDAAKKLNV